MGKVPGPDEHGAKSIEQRVKEISCAMPYALCQCQGVKMTEAIQESVESGNVARSTGTGFEPQIMAFCCEH